MERLDEKTMDKKVREAEAVLEFMSHTIDDFRNFFMPKKSKEEFYLRGSMDSIMTIISSALSNNSILVDMDIPEDIKLNTYANEFQQVILNIITNAKDVLIQNKIQEPWIKIYAKETENNVILLIEDNGGGIKVEPKSKVFEPYFTTKKDSDGTGIGLYMSKIIVEKNMNGKLRVRDTTHGARFEIYLPK